MPASSAWLGRLRRKVGIPKSRRVGQMRPSSAGRDGLAGDGHLLQGCLAMSDIRLIASTGSVRCLSETTARIWFEGAVPAGAPKAGQRLAARDVE